MESFRLARDWGVDGGHLVQQGLVVRAVPGLVEVELVIERLLVEERQESDPPAQERLAVLADCGGGEPSVIVGEVVHGEAKTHEVSAALVSGLTVIPVSLCRRSRHLHEGRRPPGLREQIDARCDDPGRQHARRQQNG